jgi:transposase
MQALERTQPILPMGLGYVEGVTHNYVRHGTTTLFAAFDPLTGTVLSQCKRRHRHQEFLDFLRHVDTSVPKTFEVHLIIDNYATHKHPRVQRWLAARSRYHVHFTPTYSSWLNEVEIWFNIITQKVIRRGTFRSVKNLSPKSNASSTATTARPDLSPGRQRPLPSSKKSSDYANVFLGRDTSVLSHKVSTAAPGQLMGAPHMGVQLRELRRHLLQDLVHHFADRSQRMIRGNTLLWRNVAENTFLQVIVAAHSLASLAFLSLRRVLLH